MITGLRLKISSKELRDHCTERASYHRDRANDKEKELPKLKEAMEQIKNAGRSEPASLARMSKASASYNLEPDDAVNNLESDIKNHRNRAMVFDYFASHLFDEDYNLEENDLRRLEIVK